MSDFPAIPDPAVVNKWTGQIRAWAGVLAMFGVAVPNIPDAKLQAYVSAILLFIGVTASVWSWIEKVRQGDAAKAMAVDSAVASANSGRAVVVAVTTVTPTGVPNRGVAIPVTHAERAMATVAG